MLGNKLIQQVTDTKRAIIKRAMANDIQDVVVKSLEGIKLP